MRKKLPVLALIASVLVTSQASASGQTTTYTYDARGRLVKSEHAGGRNDSVVVTQQFDPADNRTQQVVTGRSRPRVIVVPLNGFTVIPLKD